MSNYPPGVTDDDSHFTDETEPDEEERREEDVTPYHYGRANEEQLLAEADYHEGRMRGDA